MRDIESKVSERAGASSDQETSLIDGAPPDGDGDGDGDGPGGGFDRGTVLIMLIGAVVTILLGFLLS